MVRFARLLWALLPCVIVAGCSSTANVGTSTIGPPSSSVGVVAAQTLSFAMPVSGFALYATDNTPAVRIFDVDGHQVGAIEGSRPQQYYGSTKGVVVEREDGLRLARPGASELVSVSSRWSSGLVVPGWIESGRCATHPERPLLEICDKEITVRDGQGAVVATVARPNAFGGEFGGRWIDAFLSPDGQWVGANWQGGCEVVWGFVASLRDGTPVALIENADGPAPSGFVTWLASGEAVGSWRRAGDCGDRDAIGVYRFRPGEAPRLWFTTTGGFAVW